MSSRRTAAAKITTPRACLEEELQPFAELFRHTASIEGTGKRKVDGEYAATRLGKPATTEWLNERFRQTFVRVTCHGGEGVRWRRRLVFSWRVRVRDT